MLELNNKPMTWEEIKKVYPKQVVGIACDDPDDIDFDAAVVKYAEESTPYDEMIDMAFDGKIFMMNTDEDSRLVMMI